jgi:GSH-dependent disulfide-bond oxidoreductase
VIRLFAAPTPDARKITVMLEETGLAYEVVRREQPPAIEDDEADLELAEAGAILIYLAERSGRFFPVERRFRYPTLRWLLHQEQDGERLFAALDSRLREAAFLAGPYTIADVSAYPWVMRHTDYGASLENRPALKRWAEEIGGRPAVQRGMAALKP